MLLMMYAIAMKCFIFVNTSYHSSSLSVCEASCLVCIVCILRMHLDFSGLRFLLPTDESIRGLGLTFLKT